MLTSIIYSTITTHDSSEVNFYIMDFVGEKVTPLKKEILATENEKIDNLFKMIVKIIDDRKKLFVDYNGSFDFYINHGGKQIPLIIVMINNVEAFLESYPDYEDLLGQITRDCLKYGVVFVLTTNGPNTIRYRLRQNFRQNLVLQFNDPSDYATILPGARKKEPSKIFGLTELCLRSLEISPEILHAEIVSIMRFVAVVALHVIFLLEKMLMMLILGV